MKIALNRSLPQNAFTLAEVLITLAIVGIVAALTLPNLIENYKKTVLVNQLKKSMAVAENGFKLIMAKEGVTKLSDTELWQKLDNKGAYGLHMTQAFLDELKTYFASDHACTSNYSSGLECDFYYRSADYNKIAIKQLNGNLMDREYLGTDYAIYLKDGSIMGLSVFFSTISLDVNGLKAPNQLGRDIFVFKLNDNGKLEPFKNECKSLEEYVEETLSTIPEEYRESQKPAIVSHYTHYISGSCYHCDSRFEMDYGKYNSCAQKIISDGWKMNY